MNNLLSATLVNWDTRNERQDKKAAAWCMDYGLKPLNKKLFIGNLSSKERSAISKKFKASFYKKTDNFSIMPLCKGCFEAASIGAALRQKIGPLESFELVQIPEKPRKI